MLDGKIALINGPGQGIGRAIALEMAQQGAGAIAVADRSEETAIETAQMIADAGANAIQLTCDLRDRDQIEAMVQATVARFGGLDVLVNNVGVIETSLTSECAIDELPEDVWDAVYEINLKAVWLATKFAAPHLRRSTRGPSIVNRRPSQA
jgi:NAD(P)-dependent dehydrogenase (short-subunit alcohol dehydrogenase family)